MSEAHTPGPWTWRDASGAGIQISATLPNGFKFEHTDRAADGNTSSMTFTLRDCCVIEIADARWVQFETESWGRMQKANARLIAAAPDLLAACKEAETAINAWSVAVSTGGRVDVRAMCIAVNAVRAAIAKAEGRAQ